MRLGCETVTRLDCPLVEFITNIAEREAPVLFSPVVNCSEVLPVLPVVWLTCNHVEAGLLIVHSAFAVTVKSIVDTLGVK